MKTIVLMLMLVAATAGAESWESIGIGVGSAPREETPQEKAARAKEEAAAELKRKIYAAGKSVVRAVGTNVYNVVLHPSWETLYDYKVAAIEGATVICSYERQDGELVYIALTNWPGQKTAVTGTSVESIRAMRVGRITSFYSQTIALYDYGVPTNLPVRVPTEAELQTAKEKADARKSEQEAAVLKYQKSLAEKGDAYGLYRMGVRYVVGDGVERDEKLGRQYLERASALGNVEAKAALEKSAAPAAETTGK